MQTFHAEDQIVLGEEFAWGDETHVFEVAVNGSEGQFCYKAKVCLNEEEVAEVTERMREEVEKGSLFARDNAYCYGIYGICVLEYPADFTVVDEGRISRECVLIGILMKRGVFAFAELDSKKMSEQSNCFVVSELLQCLHFLKQNGVVHGDIKPFNLIVDNDDVEPFAIKLSDFESLINEGSTLYRATMEYASPEVLFENDDITSAADMWSFGATLYDFFVGSSPYPDIREVCDVKAYLKEAAYMYGEEFRSIPKLFKNMILRCLELDPEARPSAMKLLSKVTKYANRMFGSIKPCECNLEEIRKIIPLQ
jgi:serine/threonine protein kinase